MREYPSDVGSVDAGIVSREWYQQGMIFKSWKNYNENPSGACYAPELNDTVYTRQDFLNMCNNQKDFADELFSAVDWQSPEAYLEELISCGEWVRCQQCGRLIDFGRGERECKQCRVVVI